MTNWEIIYIAVVGSIFLAGLWLEQEPITWKSRKWRKWAKITVVMVLLASRPIILVTGWVIFSTVAILWAGRVVSGGIKFELKRGN